METILANAAKELPSVVVFFLLVVFVLNWITKYTNKRDEQWQNFLGGAEEVRGKREEDWRNFLESQQQAAATLSQ